MCLHNSIILKQEFNIILFLENSTKAINNNFIDNNLTIVEINKSFILDEVRTPSNKFRY